MTVMGSGSAPSVSWTARVPRDLAEQVEAAMPLLGLTNRTEAMVAALRMLRRHAREAEVLAAVDAEYGAGAVVPVGAVTSGFDELIAAEDAEDAGDHRNRAGGTEDAAEAADTVSGTR